MKASSQHRLFWSIAPLVIGIITPSAVIFYLEVFVGRIRPVAAVADILRRQFGGGHNLFLLALFGLIPFAVLSVICYAAASRFSAARLSCLGIGGLMGILGRMVAAHVAVWYPLYGGGHMSSTAVIAFIFVPFWCLPALGVGLFVGWIVSLLWLLRRSQ